MSRFALLFLFWTYSLCTEIHSAAAAAAASAQKTADVAFKEEHIFLQKLSTQKHRVSVALYTFTPQEAAPGRPPLVFFPGKAGCVKNPLYKDQLTEFANKHKVRVYGLDWLSQGASSPHMDNLQAIHINGFGDYDHAMRVALETVRGRELSKRHGLEGRLANAVSVIPKQTKNGAKSGSGPHAPPEVVNVDIMAISMGACITFRCVQNGGIPGIHINRVIAISPMVILPGLAAWKSIRGLMNVAYYINQGHHFAPGTGPWSEKECRENHAKRKHFDQGKTDAHVAFYNENKGCSRDGVSCSWLAGAQQAVANLNTAKVTVPVLVITVEGDDIVSEASQTAFVGKLPQAMQMVFKGLPHDPFFGSPEALNPALVAMGNYLYPPPKSLEGKGSKQNAKAHVAPPSGASNGAASAAGSSTPASGSNVTTAAAAAIPKAATTEAAISASASALVTAPPPAAAPAAASTHKTNITG